jgi:nucleoside-diphosphate-sugar epimerase
MHVLITGAAGMIGRKLAERLAREGAVNGQSLARLTLADIVPAARPAGFAGPVEVITSDLSVPGVAEKLLAPRPELIFHLAGVVSAEAELDFDKGYRINLGGMRGLLDAIRALGDGYRPNLVFTSSVAVYGAPFPDAIDDDFSQTPHTSYGAQKAMCELLLADHTRRGFVDGIGIRLPSVCVRPGKPNKAASGFWSNIIREPLAGREAVLPVPDSVLHTFASPRTTVGYLLHAAGLPRDGLGGRVNLTMPGVCCTVEEQIAALRRIAGDKAVARIRREADPMIARIVAGWPRRFAARRALALGFRPDASFDEIIRIHIEDEVGGTIAA